MIVGTFAGELTIIDPGDPTTEKQCILQHSFQLPIISVAVGRFLAASDDNFLAVLLTQRLCICQLYSGNGGKSLAK